MKIRWVMAVCIVTACGLCGRSWANAARRRVKLLADIQTALKLLNISIKDRLLALEEALSETGFEPFAAAAKRIGAGVSPDEAWRQACALYTRRGKCADCLKERELTALNRLFGYLGDSGRAEQEERILSCIRTLETAEIQARDAAEKNGKLSVSIGILFGMAVAVLTL